MAQDATGTPTSLGIPKFNTAVDAPSGKGGNAQMDAIDVLIAALPQKPAGIIAGETVVYNGSTFVRSSVTKLSSGSFGPVVNADVDAAAAIAQSKLAFDAWQTYTPTWTGTGTNPAIGNGTITGRFVQIGKTVHGFIRIDMGTTTTYGSSGWILSVPVAAQSNSLFFPVILRDASAGEYLAFTRANTTSSVVMFHGGSVAGTVAQLITATNPFTWVSTDNFECWFTYEAA